MFIVYLKLLIYLVINLVYVHIKKAYIFMNRGFRGSHLGSGANAAKFTVNEWEKS